jgi:hypothetical protein
MASLPVRRPAHTRRRAVGLLSTLLAVCLGAFPLALSQGAAGAPDSVVARAALLVRSTYTLEFGVDRPTDVTYAPDANALLVASPAAGQPLLEMSPGGELRRPAGPVAGTALTLMFDPVTRAAAVIAGQDLVRAAPGSHEFTPQSTRTPLGAIADGVAGAAFDAAGALLLLDARAHEVVRIPDPAAPDQSTRLRLAGLGSIELRGIAYNPADGRIYVGDPAGKRLLGVDEQGEVRAVYDLADAAMANQQGFTFAPSADPTDDPQRLSAFVSDSGGLATFGQVAELALDGPVTTAGPNAGRALSAPTVQAFTAETALLVQTIDASQWSPPAPDTSGVVWLGNRLAVVDSEVEEMGIWQGANLFESTTAGQLLRTGSTTAFSNEPTGVGYRASDNTLLISDDNANRITFLNPGVDGLFGNADDTWTILNTLPLCDDAEDVAHDPTTGHIFIVDGVSTEVFRVSPGTDGVFGNSNDVWSNFDVGQFGARDPEGIEYNPANDSLLVSDGRTEMVYEVSKSGVLLRTIDIAAAGSLNAASVALAPGSVQPGRLNLYITDRGVDNGADPNENDGRIFEMSFGAPGANNPPTVQSVTIDQASPETNDTLTATVVASDPDGDPLVHSYQWLKNGVAVAGATASAYDLSVAGNGDAGDQIAVRVTTFDGQVSSSPVTSAPVTVASSGGGGENSPPIVESVTIDQASPRTNDTLTATVVATDPDGDPLTYSHQWTKNGADISGATSPSLDLAVAGNGDKADAIAVRVTASDGHGGTGTGTSPVVSGVGATYNTAGANVTAHAIPLPAGIVAGDLLVATFPYDGGGGAIWPAGWTEIVDRGNSSQGLAVAYRIANGAEGASVTVTTSSEQAVGFVYRITGWHGSTPPEAVSAIGSSTTPDPPSLTPSWGSDTLWIAAYSINGGPNGAGPAYPLTDSQRFARTGGGGAAGGAVAAQAIATATLDPGPFTNSANNAWSAATIAVRAGSATTPSTPSAPVTSAAVAVLDSLPVFSQDLTNRSNVEGAVVSLSAGATDADGDALTYGATGLPTGLSINAGTGLISGTIAVGAAAQSPFSAAVTVRQGAVPDATDTFTWSVTVAPVNAPPTVTSVTIDQASPRTNDTLTATVVASDPNGDPLTYGYQWRKNGVDIAGAVGATLALSTAGNGDKGDSIAVRVIASDAQASSAPVTSAAVAVLDSVPVFAQDLGNQSSVEGGVVSLSAGATDADGDALTYEATGLPAGLSINAGTGLISGTVAVGAAAQSPFSAAVTVRQGAVPDATDSFTWTVTTASATPPTVSGIGATYNTAGTTRTAHPIPLPTGIVAGELLLAVFPYDGGAGATWPAGWTEIADRANSSHGLAVAYRIANGTEGSTVTVTTAAELAVGFVYRITGWHGSAPPEIATAIGSSATPDPPSLTPTWGSGNTLWLAAYGINGGPNAEPTYPLTQNRRWARTGGSGASGGALASQAVVAATLDPGTFVDGANNAWAAATIAIRSS